MLFAVEGPDGAGKTTFVRRLREHLLTAGRECVLERKCVYNGVDPIRDYVERLEFYLPGQGLDLILDRCWLSDTVYGPIYRGHTFPMTSIRAANEWFLSMGGVYVTLDDDDDVLKAGADQEVRAEYNEKADEVIHVYRDLWDAFDSTSDPVTRFHSTKPRLLTDAELDVIMSSGAYTEALADLGLSARGFNWWNAAADEPLFHFDTERVL